MGVVHTIIAIMLLCLAGSLVLGVAWVVVRALPIEGIKSRLTGMKLRKAQAALLAAEKALREDGQSSASSLAGHLSNAFLLPARMPGLKELEEYHTHNLEVLERIVNVAESKGRHLTSLPVVEELLERRLELFRSRMEISENCSSLLKRRKQKGQTTPDWVASEFDKRAASLDDELLQNLNAVRKQISSLIQDCLKNEEGSQVTYH